MQSKLTLRLDDALIKQAKRYAQEHDKSLSQVVADYFQHITQTAETTKLPPVTKSLVGVLKEKDLDVADYKAHLEEKHL